MVYIKAMSLACPKECGQPAKLRPTIAVSEISGLTPSLVTIKQFIKESLQRAVSGAKALNF